MGDVHSVRPLIRVVRTEIYADDKAQALLSQRQCRHTLRRSVRLQVAGSWFTARTATPRHVGSRGTVPALFLNLSLDEAEPNVLPYVRQGPR